MSIASTSMPRERTVSLRGLPGADVLLATAVLLAATLWHVLSPANTDIAWLLTVGEHILDGAKPYADIIETNPPGSVLLYLPAVVLGRSLGVTPETMVILLTSLIGVASLALAVAMMRRRDADAASAPMPLAAIMTAILFVLPASSFGQREHIIVVLSLPLFAALGRACAGRGAAPPAVALIAGLGAGMAFAIKPYYGLGLIGPLGLLVAVRGWRGLLAIWPVWLALATTGLLGLAQLGAFPHFTEEVLPLLLRVYLPDRQPLGVQLGSPSTLLYAACMVVYGMLRRRAGRQPVGDVAALASLGCFAACLLQGKGWPYHAYPAIAAALAGIGALLVDPKAWARRERGLLMAGAVGAGLAGIVATLWFDAHRDIREEAPGLAEAVAVLGPHPKIMSLASDIAVGHPFVREVGGRWVGTLMSSWIGLGVHRLNGTADPGGPHGADLALQDRIMASDIRDRAPDAILAGGAGWSSWLASQPQVAQALRDYPVSRSFGPVLLFTRVAP